MRITYVVHQFLPRFFTGTEQYTYAIAQEARRRGHDVDVFTLEPDFSEQDRLFEQHSDTIDGLPVTRVRAWYHLDRDFERMEYRHPFLAERFRRHLEERRPDVVHVFHLRYLGVDLIAEARALRIPVVVHLMDFWFLCPAVVLRRPDGRLCDGPPDGGFGCVDCIRPDLGAEIDRHGLRESLARAQPCMPSGSSPRPGVAARVATLTERPRILRDALLRAQRIVAPSHFLKSVFVRNGIPAERIDVVTYGIDPSRIAAVEPRVRRTGADLQVGFIGSIAEHKGTDLAVDAVASSSGPLHLTVHGRVDGHDVWAKELASRARSMPQVTFAGAFPREQLGRVLASIDVLVVPSRWYENTPFVVLEAFAAQVPVLVADLGGLSECVRDGIDGELFRPGDVADLRTRLLRLAREPERLATYRRNRPSVKSIATNGDEITAVYADAISSPRQP
ncbi:MAG: glycosyltransferase [Planctomycetota bacterium]